DRTGLTDAARLRGTAVTLAAAGRSAGVTTAITYEVRVGTSICESAARGTSVASASPRFGIKGARRSQMLEGTWVKAMERISPRRLATQGAARNERPERIPVQKKIVPAVSTER